MSGPRRVEELYHEALKRPQGQREAFLSEACGSDAELLSEVRSLLGYAEQARHLLDEPVAAAATERLAVAPGTRLGPYEIGARLGAGGMGEVYRARDTRLGRDVAVKVLPGAMAGDADALARFQREARAIAALGHPNVCALHDVGSHDGIEYLVMELLEGETLAQRLERGTPSLEEALRIGIGIAEALEAAHARGIVHRDLKPGNVMLSGRGHVKVMDFGLARTLPTGAGEGGAATVSAYGTRDGVILGTAAYMSPEQARGQEVDARTDVWALGCVLYEALAGRRAFAGRTISDTLAAVLEREVEWEALPGSTPAVVRGLLRRCLRKDRERRLRDAGDARLELEDALAALEPAAPTRPGPAGGRRARGILPWVVAGVMAVVAAGLALRPSRPDAPPRPPVHFVLDTAVPPTGARFGAVAVSPDGRHLVYVGQGEGEPRRLWLRPLGAAAAEPLAGTEHADQPFWSPDGEWIAYFSGDSLYRVGLTRGSVQRLCRLPLGAGLVRGGTWGGGDLILFGQGGRALYSVPAAGGEAELVAEVDESRRLAWPQWLPDGERFLVSEGSGALLGPFDLKVGSLATPEQRRTLAERLGVYRFAPPGHLFSLDEGVPVVRRLDPERLSVSGEPVPVAPAALPLRAGAESSFASEGTASANRTASFSVSANGVLSWVERRSARFRLTWVDREGGELGALADPGPYGQLALSRDGRRVAVEVGDPESTRIWVLDVERGVPERVTRDAGGRELNPVWSPDGRELVFGTWRDERPYLMRARPGSNQPVGVLRELEAFVSTEDWSPDGALLYNAGFAPLQRAVWSLPVSGDAEPEVVLAKPRAVDQPQISPDGLWIAYIETERGAGDLVSQVYVEPFRRVGPRVRVSAGGGGQPEWRADGSELFYLAPDRRLMAVPFGVAGGEPVVGAPQALFETAGEYRPAFNDYAVSADGSRFLVKVPVEGDENSRIHVLLDWPALLD